MPRKFICNDCPEDSALEYFKQRIVAERHAERTGHEITELEDNRD